MPETLYLIDGHAQVYRAFYAVEGLRGPGGRPTGAAFGFTRMFMDLLKRRAPDRIAAVFDAPGKTFRHERYPDYKATRKPTPPELIEQVPVIQDIVRAGRVPVYSLPGYEADDVLATLARQGAEQGFLVYLVTGDKDCGQLLSDRIRIYDPSKDLDIDPESFVAKHGYTPDKLTDVMGLWGDTSDNIPGVPGFGEKTAGTLIREYGDLETLLARADEVKGKKGETLRQHLDNARLSKELATLDDHAPVELDADACRRRPPDAERMRTLFEEMGFHTLLRDLDDAAPADDARPAAPPETRDYQCVDTPEAFRAFLAALEKQPLVAFDTETTGLDPMRARLVGVSVSWAEKTGFYLPFLAPAGAKALGAAEWEALKATLERGGIAVTGQHLKFDLLVMRRAGAELPVVAFDTLLASHLAYGHLNEHNLDALAYRHFGLKKIPTSDLIGSGKNALTMDLVPTATVAAYACEDADVAWRLTPVLKTEVERAGLTRLLEEVELPLARILADMQYVGVKIDAARLERQSAECGAVLDALTAEAHAQAGRAFNPNSPKQVAEVLFGDMGLPVVRRTRTGASTDEDTLQVLAEQGYAIAKTLLEIRAYAKLKSGYLDALPAMVNPETGRVHATFTQTGTATGRLASRDPNLQNIPVRTERGRAVRQAFVTEPGWRLLSADYSQVELRLLAHFCGDESLRRAFEEDRDIHRVVAAELAGVDEDAVSKDMRSAAKAVNFGIIYGQTAFGLAGTTGMARGAAQRFIDGYFARYPRVRAWIEDTVAKARADGYVSTFLGRRRELPELRSSNKAKAARAEREAVNTVVQGSAADLIKTAMVRIEAKRPNVAPRARLLSQIHDELLFEGPEEDMPALMDLVRREMEAALPLSVPLKVDAGTGENWLDAH